MATSITADIGTIPIRSKAMASLSECSLSQSRNGSNPLAGQDWAPHKRLLHQKYLEEGLSTREVQRFMLEIHQFSKSIQQYERIFRKWGFKKNLKHKDYDAISHKLMSTSFDEENTEIMANGKFVPFRNLKSRISRHITPTLASKWSPNVAQTCSNQSSVPFYSNRRSKQDEIVTRQVLAAGRQIWYANNLPWFGFLDILAETYFKSWTPCHVEVENRVSNIVLSKPKSEAILFDRSDNIYSANQILLNTFWKGLGASIANEGCNVELQSSSISTSQVRQLFLQHESQIPRRYPNDYEESIKTIVDGYMPAAAFIAIGHIFYLVSNRLCDGRIKADCAYLLLKSNAIPWLKSCAASGAITAKAVLRELVDVACCKRDKELLRSLVRGDNSMDLNSGSLNLRLISMARCTLLQQILYEYNMDLSFQHEDQQKVLDCIEILLEAGSDPDVCTCDVDRRPTSCGNAHSCWRCSPLQLSMMTATGSELVRCLLNHSANVCRCLNITPMIARDAEVEIDVLQRLLEDGASSRFVRAPTVMGHVFDVYRGQYWFPLQAALGQKRSDIATLLLLHNAKPNEFAYLEHELTNLYSDDEAFERSSRDKGRNLFRSLLMYNWLSPLTLSLIYDIRMSETLLELDTPVEDRHYGWLAQRYSRNLIGEVDSYTTSQKWLDSSDILEQRQDGFQTALAAAVSSGSLRMVKMILERGAIMDSPHSESPLIIAARMGRYDLVRFLLDAGAQVDGTFSLHHLWLHHCHFSNNRKDYTEYLVLSPLSEASARDHIEIMTELINRGANIDHCFGNSGVTPLHAAAICGSYRAVNLLFAHGCVAVSHPGTRFCSVNAIVRLQWFELQQLSEDTSGSDNILDQPSAITVSNEEFAYSDIPIESSWPKAHRLLAVDDIVRYKLRSARSPVPILWSMEIPMMHSFVDMFFVESLQSRNINIAKILLRQGYVVNLETGRRLLKGLDHCYFDGNLDEAYHWFMVLCTAQDWSLKPEERLNIAEAMYERIENYLLFMQPKKTAHVFSQLKEKAREMLVESLRGCSEQSPQFSKILFRALQAEELEVVQLLLDHGVKIDHQPDILVLACYRGYGDIVTQLLVSGADVNAESKDNSLEFATPLNAACARGHLNVVKTLLAVGAVLMRETSDCTYSGLVTACSHGHVDVVKELIAHRIDIDQPAHWWRAFAAHERADNAMPTRTSLQAACEEGHLDIVTLLINHDANVNAPAGNYQGVTALQAAAINGHFGIVQRLIGAGARVAAAASHIHGRTAINGAAERGRLDMVKYLLDHYDGDEPMSTVCWKAAGFAKREGHMVVVELLKSYPGACTNTWQNDYTWSLDSNSDSDPETERPANSDTSDIDIFEFVHEEMVL